MITPQQHWTTFKTAFCKALDQIPKANFEEAWSHVRKKTEFYEWTLIPAVGQHLGCRMEFERMRCDYTFLNQAGVPVIAVESENAHATAWQEMEYLCSLAVPLKVLMLSCDWQNVKKKSLPEWTDIIRKHHAAVSVGCLYVIISGEWEDEEMPIYYFTLIDTAGSVIQETMHAIGS